MRFCPWCGVEAGAIGAGDESIDYCHDCDRVIEGQTTQVDIDFVVAVVGRMQERINIQHKIVIAAKQWAEYQLNSCTPIERDERRRVEVFLLRAVRDWDEYNNNDYG